MSLGDVAGKAMALAPLLGSPIGPMPAKNSVGTAAWCRLAHGVAWRLRRSKELPRRAIIARRQVQKGYSSLGECVKSALGGVTSTPPKRPFFRHYA